MIENVVIKNDKVFIRLANGGTLILSVETAKELLVHLKELL